MENNDLRVQYQHFAANSTSHDVVVVEPTQHAEVEAAAAKLAFCRDRWVEAGSHEVGVDSIEMARNRMHCASDALRADQSFPIMLAPLGIGSLKIQQSISRLRNAWEIDWYFVGFFFGGLSFVFAMCLFVIFISNFLIILFFGLIALTFGFIVGSLICFVPSDAWTQATFARWQMFLLDRNDRSRQFEQARLEYERLAELHPLWLDWTIAEEEYNAVLRAFLDRKNQLKLRNWKAFKGEEFELFLKEVLEVCGYDVATTKRTGDQGVDLIATKSGKRLAIQAKGYVSSVGTSAVQEVHAGRSFYGCTGSVVITNSEFTSGAMQLARSVECVLIDGDMIQPLIEGNVL